MEKKDQSYVAGQLQLCVNVCVPTFLVPAHRETIKRLTHTLLFPGQRCSFNGHFPRWPGQAGTRMSPFWLSLELRMEVVVTTASIRCAKLQLNCHHQQTNTQFLPG